MNSLLEIANTYLPKEDIGKISKALGFAENAHKGQLRKSGDPFIVHPVETARYLADLSCDTTTLVAALLHDVIEDCDVSFSQLEKEFGTHVAELVDGVTKLNRLDINIGFSDDNSTNELRSNNAASLRKMLIAMSKDLRVILIKLSDRLHNMSTLASLTEDRQIIISQETLDIYAPLAHRLGMWDVKWRLEDLAFRYIQPDSYKEIASLISRKRLEREKYINLVQDMLGTSLKQAKIEATVMGRAKHLYSIFKKIEAYEEQGKDFDDIHDLFALRVLVNTKVDCYTTLSIVHELWHPLSGQFDDYIANPKENMYQSLHTTVLGLNGMPLEVQIRTHEMHRLAEFGIASHWTYKEGKQSNEKYETKINWLRQLIDVQKGSSGPEEFLENIKTDIFQDQVYVYTPKGDIFELPVGSTPIDLAYRIHTEVGHRCIGAKVNGKLVSLDYKLTSGDSAEILTSKVTRGPSLDWLNVHAGYIQTATAKERIKSWFRRQERSTSLNKGREMFQRDLKKFNIEETEQEVAKTLKFSSVEDFFTALGSGSITIQQVLSKLNDPLPLKINTTSSSIVRDLTSSVEVLGVGDLLTNLAKCCSPLPGDDIVGYITRGKGITVHQIGCENIQKEQDRERVVEVNWGKSKSYYPVRISIHSWDRVGLLRDLTSAVASEKINVNDVVSKNQNDGTAFVNLDIFISTIEQLGKIFAKIEEVQGIISVERI
ncbi:MAG: bifunctional (p)ppGpp synthetase/guanosine-3',5'-bis(diphosphate) 3'-pyrophosphohydrolase [SAR202 cluster bacterium]|nr:(p)ppGpp synthetase [Chloroflexota bacterium]MQG50685.1 bifunctional (p)ppGpp synthetase/guanosine-3',5'-bis(diphosphate) 3'-pyrophosphohydrolase [SAR202 cluster bacterium]